MLKQIQYFQSVVEENSFTKAANSHFISQSAISQ
ncbi:LysR family transcriptional regulator [Streptococcus macedonicus]|nr:LysR family transcriptional regulator [Streptococcus macedonicus]